jgi:DHA3 family tetracycline resistance protein-like MFS transporter
MLSEAFCALRQFYSDWRISLMSKYCKFNAYFIYLLIAAVVALGQGTVWMVSSVYQVEMVKLTPLQLVLVGTVLELVTLLCQVPTGALADLYSRRLSVILGYSLMGASYLFQALVPRFEAILLAQIALAAGFSFIGGAEEAWVTDEIGDERAGKAFLRATQWGLLGSLLAAPLSLTLANLFQLNIPMIVGASILLLLGLFLLFFMPENHFRRASRVERKTLQMLGRQMINGGKAVRASAMLWCILGTTLFAALASEGFDRLWTAHFLQDFILPALWGLKSVTWFGIISVGSTLLALIATELINRYLDTGKPRAVIGGLFALNILLMVSTALFGLVSNFYLAMGAFWLASVVRAVRTPLHAAWMTQYTDPRERATIFSFDGMVDPIGQIAGGPLVGVIGERFSLRAAMVAVSIIMAPILFFLSRAFGLSRILPVR